MRKRYLILNNLFSRQLLAFFAILYSTLREIILTPGPGSNADSWLTLGFSTLLFYVLMITVMEKNVRKYDNSYLWLAGTIWSLLAIIIQFSLFFWVYGIKWQLIVASYNIFNLEPWPIIILLLFLAPRICNSIVQSN